MPVVISVMGPPDRAWAVQVRGRLAGLVDAARAAQVVTTLSRFAQERVWFLNQLAPGSIAYNFQFTIRFAGPLDPEALRRTLSEIVRRHEVLRTSFPAAGGRPSRARNLIH